MTSSGSKGDRRERELVNELDARGFKVMRAPSSGSATTRDLPDVLAARDAGDLMYAFEVKASNRDDAIYISSDEVGALTSFSLAFGAHALIGVRYDYTDWAFLEPAELYRTDSGENYRVRHEDVTQEESTDLKPTILTFEPPAESPAGELSEDGAGEEA